MAGIIGMPGRLRSVQAAGFAGIKRPTSSECAGNDRRNHESHGLAAVRGFLAGVVRKRLKLKLSSNEVDSDRVYRIAGGHSRKAKPRQSKRGSS